MLFVVQQGSCLLQGSDKGKSGSRKLKEEMVYEPPENIQMEVDEKW